MNFKRSFMTLLFSVLMLFTGMQIASAGSYKDVAEDFWAYPEIDDVVSRDVIYLFDDGTFRPWETVERVEFTGMLLRALNLSTAPITQTPNYSDVNMSTFGYEDIARSDQFGLIYGYTDGEFKPSRLITKAETASIMSHITKDSDIDTSLIRQFSDWEEVPGWCVFPFSKAIKYGLYVNHPLENELNPNRNLNRAEAAVLLAKLMKALNLVEDKYKVEEETQPEEPAEYLMSTEHFYALPKVAVDRLNITNLRRIILAGNVFEVEFLNKFNSKKHQIGDEVEFYFPKDVYTKEGTLVIPKNSRLLATIEELRKKDWINKNAEVYLHFYKLIFPDGKETEFIARVLNNNEGVLRENYWLKPLEYTLAGAAIGTGAGLGIGAGCHEIGNGLAIGLPTGAGVGLLTGFLTKGVNYKAHRNEKVLVELKVDSSIWNDGVEPIRD